MILSAKITRKTSLRLKAVFTGIVLIIRLIFIESNAFAQVSANDTEALENDVVLKAMARLEAEKLKQDSVIAASKAQRQLDAEKLMVAQGQAADTSLLNVTGGSAVSAAQDSLEPELTSDNKIVLLKSDANPNAYLDALTKVEKQIAADAAKRPDKRYELKPIGSSGVEVAKKKERKIDPSLEAQVLKDREAIAEHQVVAKEKERQLREGRERDREMLALYDSRFESELKAAEQELFNEVDSIASLKTSDSTATIVEVVETVEEKVVASKGLVEETEIAEEPELPDSTTLEANVLDSAQLEILKEMEALEKEINGKEEKIEATPSEKKSKRLFEAFIK
ncbi:hypothetical protein ACFLR1_06335, partial [Bacteroidota bacterium]